MPDAHSNFAVSTVATPPSPASSGTSLSVASGEGSRFPAVPFNATVRPANAPPDPSNAEIIRVTARSTDSFGTIVRAQEGSSARAIQVGDHISATVTAKSLTDIEGDVTGGFARFVPITEFRGTLMNTGQVAGTYLASPTMPSNFVLAAANSSVAAFYLDPADYAVAGRTSKLRLEAFLHSNSVSSGTINFVVNLAPIATWGGGSNANPTVATVSAATTSVTFSNPGASAHLRSVGGVVDFPAAGHFVVSVVTSATMAANSDVFVAGRVAVQAV